MRNEEPPGGPQTRIPMRVDGPQQDVTFKIIGAAMTVHNALGPGLKEIAYHKAMSLELEKVGLGFQEEKSVEIYVDGSPVGLLYLDHLVEATVVVEEKAFSHLLQRKKWRRSLPTWRRRVTRWDCS